MSTTQSPNMTARTPLRLWPGVTAAVLLLLVKFVLPAIIPAAADLAMLGGFAGALIILLWWLFFSRAPWVERIGALAVMVAAVYATMPFLHRSIAGGAQGYLPIVLSVPTLSLALVAWAVAGRRMTTLPRWLAMVACLAVGAAVWTLARTDGVRGGGFDLHWRWTPTAEERLLARAGRTPEAAAGGAVAVPDGATPRPSSTEPAPGVPPTAAPPQPSVKPAPDASRATPETPVPAVSVTATPAEWPGFRGPTRDGVITRANIQTDWAASPPVELWRRPIGPGWSSFAVNGERIYTHEQRGDYEVVSCYDARSGEPVWQHQDAVRFWESNGGPGPRATPALAHGRVYTQGGTGIVNAIDAADGRVIWSRKAASDTGKRVPYWGIAGSPLVVGDLVVIAASGRLIAYDAATGAPRWRGPDGGGSYSSPHLATIAGVEQVLLQHAGGVTSVAPADGARLWTHAWEGTGIVQPAMTADGDVLVSTTSATSGNGIRRLAVARETGRWTAVERWTSTGLKPYFNDFVVHEGHAYGFDGSILSCIDLADGTRRWKGGRYGNGQLVLLPDQDLLLILSEEGELGLVKAVPDGFSEVARFKALEGKTWNHPVLVGDTLFVRNGEEMAAFRLPGALR